MGQYGAQEILGRPRLRADRRARGLELLALGEKLLREHLALVAARGTSVALDLEARLDGWPDEQVPARRTSGVVHAR
jgi:hypothetical protein